MLVVMRIAREPGGVKDSHINGIATTFGNTTRVARTITGNTTPETRQERYMKGRIRTMYYEMKNLNQENTRIIIGNPGCGKTTKLIDELIQRSVKGLPLTEILYSSHTVAAIQEAQSRCLDALMQQPHQTMTMSQEELREGYMQQMLYFKTLHSLAFHLLGLSPDSLMSLKNTLEFSKNSGYNITYVNRQSQSAKFRQTKGDKMLNVISNAQLLDMSIRDYMVSKKISDFSVHEVESFFSMYRDYKTLEGVYDYTDMLVKIKHAKFDIGHLSTIIIDEAQDLSTLQWMLVDKLAEFADEIIIAGDDKQSIMTFSAADVDTFLHVPGKVETLEQSYRVPKKVWATANKIMKHMLKYRPEGTQWTPRTEEGDVRKLNSIPYTSLTHGDWLVIARTNYTLEKVASRLVQGCVDTYTNNIIPFTINGMPPFDTDIYKLFDLYATAIKKNRTVIEFLRPPLKETQQQMFKRKELIRCIKKFLPLTANKYDATITDEMVDILNKPWYEAIDLPHPVMLSYIAAAYKRHIKEPDMFEKATLRLTTIHGAKGREADNVLFITDVTQAVRDTMFDDKDDSEVKNAYVAVTRAKQKLYIVSLDHHKRGLEYYIL